MIPDLTDKLENKFYQNSSGNYSKLDEPFNTNDFNTFLNNSVCELFDVDLNVKELRIGLASRHPMLQQQYTILTPAIDHFHNLAYDWIIARKSGLYITGLHRQGKTKAIDSTLFNLNQELPFISFLHCNGQRLTNKSKESFCRYLLESFGFTINGINRKARLEVILANYIMIGCAERGGNQCVLFVDEAQLFSVVHYRYLLEIWNELRTHGFILCTVLVGQPDLKQLRAITDELDHGAVVSRFFVKGHTLAGMKSLDMLTSLMKNFDSQLCFPPGGEWPFSRFFVKEAFDKGWRIANEAPSFWSALRSLSGAGPDAIKTSGFRTAWVIDAIHGFLLDAMAKDKPSFHGTKPLWTEILKQSTDLKLIV